MNKDLEKILNKSYDKNARIDLKYRKNDLTLITNPEGLPVTLFIGKRKTNGNISGERYVKNTKVKDGVTSSHWDRKGKV